MSYKKEFNKYKKSNLLKTSADYLLIPFHLMLEHPGFAHDTNKMKIITGVTGQGKTFHMATNFIPKLVNDKGVKFVVVSFPTTEIMDKSLFVKSAVSSGSYFTQDLKDAIKMSKEGVSVILATTHQAVFVSNTGEELQRYLKTGVHFAYFGDEIHTWSTSNYDNYGHIHGHSTKKSGAPGKLYKAIAELAEFSPYIFGLTATANREQIGDIAPIGSMSLEVINELPPKNMMISKTAWLNSIEYFKDNLNVSSIDRFTHNQQYESALLKLWYSKTKKTMLVCCGNDNAETGYNLDYVLNLTQTIIYSNDLADVNEQCIAVMTSIKKQTGLYTLKSKLFPEEMDEQEIKDRLNDPGDPLRVVIVVQKGRMGMNVHSLKSFVDFRPQNKRACDGAILTEFAKQKIGRMVRIHTGMTNSEFTSKFDYDLEKYVKTLNEFEINDLIDSNGYDLLIPYTDMWRASVGEFLMKYSSTVQEARIWIDSIKNNK